MLLSRRSVQESWNEYLKNGMTPEQAKKERSRWIKIYDLVGSVITALVLVFVIFTLPPDERGWYLDGSDASGRRLAADNG